MKVLVFDTETTGLPKIRELTIYSLNFWPYIVQFSYIIYDDITNRILKIKDYIIKVPVDVIISDESIKIHGITNEISQNKGVDIKYIFDEFMLDFENVDMIIAHNLDFDLKMIKAEIMRKIHSELIYFEKELYKNYFNLIEHSKKYLCTMQESIDLCGIQAINSRGTYIKFPKLSELHFKLFNNIPNNLHNSLNDVLVCLRCYCQLKNKIDNSNSGQP
jgi:DNA polymerase III epsilon subunit-like protein